MGRLGLTNQHDKNKESDSSLSNDTMLRCSNLFPWAMIETNTVLRARVTRLEGEWEQAQLNNNALLMAQIEGQIREAHVMIYSGLDETWKVFEGCIEFLENEWTSNPMHFCREGLADSLIGLEIWNMSVKVHKNLRRGDEYFTPWNTCLVCSTNACPVA